MAITQILDDRDPAVIYSSGWVRAGSSNEFNGTTSSASDPGLTATLVFQGTQVTVYGTLGPRDVQRLAPQSNYSLDGGVSVTYQAVQRPTVQYSTRFYTSPLLQNGQHSLVVTNLGTSDSLFLDYFLVLRDDNAPPPPPPPNHGKPEVSQTPAADSVDRKPPSSPNTGTIVGSAIGAAALVILAVAIMFWLRSRNYNKRTQDTDDTRVDSFRDRSIETNQRSRHPQSVGSTYLSSSDGARYSNSGQQQYDDPSSSAPPGYVLEASEQSGTGRVRPRLYLPLKFTREHQPTPTTAT